MWSIIGLAAACLTMFSFIPQIIKVIRTRCAKDISLIMLIQLSAGVSLWILYGIHLKDTIIILANVVTLTSMLILMGLYYLYGAAQRMGNRTKGSV
ncbi:MAG: SemiSWEET transporter [Candidatus Omnitrophica bacterium]|nr:SemiSWEET transporter [Candidatus Omnitrophota bacterium]